jgi:hypothetical protein
MTARSCDDAASGRHMQPSPKLVSIAVPFDYRADRFPKSWVADALQCKNGVIFQLEKVFMWPT